MRVVYCCCSDQSIHNAHTHAASRILLLAPWLMCMRVARFGAVKPHTPPSQLTIYASGVSSVTATLTPLSCGFASSPSGTKIWTCANFAGPVATLTKYFIPATTCGKVTYRGGQTRSSLVTQPLSEAKRQCCFPLRFVVVALCRTCFLNSTASNLAKLPFQPDRRAAVSASAFTASHSSYV